MTLVLSDTRPAAPVQDITCYDWVHFAARFSAEGEAWVADYRTLHDIVGLSRSALLSMRAGDLESGRRQLEQSAVELDGKLALPPTLEATLRRWHHGAAAYYYYAMGSFARAHDEMSIAHDAVVRAVTGADFLLMFAVDCQEFCLHHSRLFRNAREWKAMWSSIELAASMTTGNAPLCRRLDGVAIYMADICAFLHACGPLTSAERQAVRGFLDPVERWRRFDRFVRAMVRIPGYGIEYV